MSYQSKLDAALALITSHNESVDAEEHKVDADAFVSRLKALGGTSEANLAACTWEDLEDCQEGDKKLPRILARSIANIFRAADPVPETGPDKIVIIDDDPVKAAARCKPLDLLDHIDLDEPDSPYAERLTKLSKGKRILVINDDGSLNVAASKTEFQRIRDGRDDREQVRVGDVVLGVHAMGYRPDRYCDEHPIVEGEALETDGSSDDGIPWGTIDFRIRQLARVAVAQTGELDHERYEEIDIFDMIEGKSWEQVTRRYPKAAVKFKELEKLGELPKLKVQLGGDGGAGGRRNDPFRPSNREF